MNQRTYVLNQETKKIELNFSKSEYEALPEETKKKIRRFYLFSGKNKVWVSRSTKNHYWAIDLAKTLGFVDGGRIGEKLTFAEQMEKEREKSLDRAERYEGYAINANERGKQMQAEFRENAKDWSWLTQPNINTSAGRSFTNRRQRILDRHDRGFQEYRKSEYFRERAATAMATADQSKLRNRTYLSNRITEGNASLRKIKSALEIVKEDTAREERLLERMEEELDKLAYFENCLDAIGGIPWSKDNIKPGYLAKVRGHWETVVKANPKTVELKSPYVPYTLKYPYAEIQEINIPEGWSEPKKIEFVNPFSVGDLLTATNISGNEVIKAFQIVKTSSKFVYIRSIAIQDNEPVRDAFISDEQERKSVRKNHAGDWVVPYQSFYLYKS